MQHVHFTHEVNLATLSEQLEPGAGVVTQHVSTDLRAADISTKALQTHEVWDRAQICPKS